MNDIFIIAIKAILINKTRSFLTMLGVIIGVGSVVLLTSIGTGLQAYVASQFASLGTNILYVVPGNPFGEGGGFGGQESMIESMQPTLKVKHMTLLLRENREYIKDGAIMAVNAGEAKYKEKTKKVTITGVTGNYGEIMNTKAAKGKWFTDADDQRKVRGCTLGSEIANELFGNVDPINKKIKIDGQTYLVTGVLEEKGGGMSGAGFDNYIYMPIHTLFEAFNSELIDNFALEVRNKD